jgi:hypothetical protein
LDVLGEEFGTNIQSLNDTSFVASLDLTPMNDKSNA